MTKTENIDIESLTALAVAGFPGMTLGDLLQLSDGLVPKAEVALREGASADAQSLLEVICQAQSNAVALSSQVLSPKRILHLKSTLERFDTLLDSILASVPLSQSDRALLFEFKSHTEKRLELMDDLTNQLEVAQFQVSHDLPFLSPDRTVQELMPAAETTSMKIVPR